MTLRALYSEARTCPGSGTGPCCPGRAGSRSSLPTALPPPSIPCVGRSIRLSFVELVGCALVDSFFLLISASTMSVRALVTLSSCVSKRCCPMGVFPISWSKRDLHVSVCCRPDLVVPYVDIWSHCLQFLVNPYCSKSLGYSLSRRGIAG